MAEIIKEYLDRLVLIIKGYVRPVSDLCLSKELITTEVYEKVLELNITHMEEARELLIAVCDTVDIDRSLFEVLMQILKEVVTLTTEVRHILSDMDRKYRKNFRVSIPQPRQPSQADCDPPKVKAVKKFIPKLVHVIGGSVNTVSDQCLSSGLIKYGTYREIIFSERNRDDKARLLLVAVMKRICTDH